MGCRGPQTYSNCALVRWNNRASWCVESGAPCCGCATAKPGTHSGNWVDNNTPFLAKRFRDINVGGFRFQPEIAAAGVTGVVAACIAIHAFGMKKTGRTHGAPIESIKDYDKKRDERAKRDL